MTKKDYVRFANLLRDIKPNKKSPCRKEWERLVNDLVVLFKEDNERFDKNRFFKACGYN